MKKEKVLYIGYLDEVEFKNLFVKKKHGCRCIVFFDKKFGSMEYFRYFDNYKKVKIVEVVK